MISKTALNGGRKMEVDEHTNAELIGKVQQLFQRISLETIAVLLPNEEAAIARDAKMAAEELAKREKARLDGFREVGFKYVEEINGNYYVIEVDNAATDATDLVQVRVERYSSLKDVENGFDYELIQICDSIDEAVMLLDRIKRGGA